MENTQQKRTEYSEAVKSEALQQRMNGKTYREVSEELSVPEDTLKKWFAPSINRHNLATIKEEALEELTRTSTSILKANIVAITEKLTEMALEGDIRAIIEVLDRVHGTPIKQKDSYPENPVKLVEVSFYESKEEIEKMEKLKKELQTLEQHTNAL